MTSIELFTLFFQTGFLTVGGGLVAMPILQEAIVESNQILTNAEFLSMIAIAQSSPGSIGINMASYFGVTQHGIGGAIIASLGLLLPSIIVITIIARSFPKFNKKPAVITVFQTIRPAMTGLIASVAFTLWTTALFGSQFTVELSRLLTFGLLVYCHFRFNLKSISLIILGAILGVLFL